jgi:hypothetical protein
MRRLEEQMGSITGVLSHLLAHSRSTAADISSMRCDAWSQTKEDTRSMRDITRKMGYRMMMMMMMMMLSLSLWLSLSLALSLFLSLALSLSLWLSLSPSLSLSLSIFLVELSTGRARNARRCAAETTCKIRARQRRL